MLRASMLSSPALSQPGLRLAVLEGCFATLPGTFTTGLFLTGFALMLGADPWALGLLTAIPALASCFQVVTPLLFARGVCRKQLTVWAASIARYLWLPIALLPFFPMDHGTRLTCFFGLLGLSTILIQIGGVSWSDWMSELVPEADRGSYFGFRNAVTALVGVAAVWAGSHFLEAYKAASSQPQGYLVLLLTALVGSLGSQVALAKQPKAPAARRPARGVTALQAPLRNKPFLRLTVMMGFWTLVMGLTGPFCYAIALKDLHAGMATIGTHAFIVTALSIIAQPLWGRVIDRKGAQATLIMAITPVALHPLYWIAMRPDFYPTIWCDAISGGIFSSGMALATSTLLMEAAPQGQRASYMSFYNMAMGVAISLSALVGGALMSRFGNFQVAGHVVSIWQALLAFGFVARVVVVAGLAALPKVRVPTLTIDTWAAAPVQSVPEPAPEPGLAAGA